MKFVLVIAAVALAAGGAAVVATGQPTAPNPLAGDWRCNTETDGIESAILMSVANDGGTRGRALVNDQVEGRWVIIEIPYSGRLRLQGRVLIEDILSFDVSSGSVDGHPLSARVRELMRAEMKAETGRYAVEEITASRLVYSGASDHTLCEKSPMPLNL